MQLLTGRVSTRLNLGGRGRSLRPIRRRRLPQCRVQASLTEVAAEMSEFQRIRVLSEALPYLQKFAEKTVVVKYGGAAMKDPSLKMGVIKDLVLLSCVGVRPVLVHGGGPEINTWLSKLGIKPVFQNGIRVTDREPYSTTFGAQMGPLGDTMEVVEMVLGGRVNKSLVSLIQQSGGRAVGLCGKDGGLIMARPMLNGKLGFTGEVIGIQTALLNTVIQGSYIPVVATVATSKTGDALNVNADTAAGEIAAALQAEKLVLMTDVPGVLRDKDDAGSLIRSLDIQSTREEIESGTIAGGMIPKVECCIRCLAQGVHAAHIVDGRQPHSLLMEILTDKGVGTMITG